MRVLTDEQVKEIRAKYAGGNVRQQDLADEYGCVVSTISTWVNPDPLIRERRFKYKIYSVVYKRRIKACDCGISYKEHVRCPICTQLLHGECDCKNDKLYYSQDLKNFT